MSEKLDELITLLTRARECEELLSDAWIVLGPYTRAYENNMDEYKKKELSELRNKLRRFYKFDDSE